MKYLDKTNVSQGVWETYYKSIEEGPVGLLYPCEPLVRIISTVRKGINADKNKYYGDQGNENKNRFNFQGSALEIGFGHISNLLMLKEKGFACTGLEVSQEAILRGNNRLKSLNCINDINLEEWKDLSKLPYKNNQFDFICGMQSIYYNIDLQNIINEIYRCIKPNGYFAFSFFSNRHEYIKYVDKVKEEDLFNVFKWSDNHPNPRIRGAFLTSPKTSDDLLKIFKQFSTKRVFVEESDFAPVFSSWWYIYGQK